MASTGGKKPVEVKDRAHKGGSLPTQRGSQMDESSSLVDLAILKLNTEAQRSRDILAELNHPLEAAVKALRDLGKPYLEARVQIPSFGNLYWDGRNLLISWTRSVETYAAERVEIRDALPKLLAEVCEKLKQETDKMLLTTQNAENRTSV